LKETKHEWNPSNPSLIISKKVLNSINKNKQDILITLFNFQRNQGKFYQKKNSCICLWILISQKTVKCLCIFEFVLFVKLFKETWLSNTQNSREIKLNLNQTRNQNALSIFWYPNFEWMCRDMTLSGSI
jgi:hypothetical protein